MGSLAVLNYELSKRALMIEMRSTCLILVLFIDIFIPTWFNSDSPSHAIVITVLDPSDNIIADATEASPN